MPRHPHEPVTPTLPFPPMPPAPPCGCVPPRMRPEPFSPGGLPAPHGFDFGKWAREKINWLLSLVPSAASADNPLADREWVARQAIGGKADKVADATEGNLAALTQDGNLADSGTKPDDFATAAQGAKADTAVQPAAIAGFVDGAEYDAEYGDPPKPTILLKHGSEVVATVDAADFVIDGMVSDVKIENGNLVITFNTDSGKQPISIPLTDIFNPDNYYTKTDVNGLLADKASKSDATLTPKYTDEWIVNPVYPEGYTSYTGPTWSDIDSGWLIYYHGDSGEPELSTLTMMPSSALSLSFQDGTTATRQSTEHTLIGYVLGSQTNKVLASEAEAEALRTEVASKANDADVVHKTGNEEMTGPLYMVGTSVKLQSSNKKTTVSFSYASITHAVFGASSMTWGYPKSDGTLALTAGTGHAGNLAALDAQGNPTDSGKRAEDFATAAQLAGKADKSDLALRPLMVPLGDGVWQFMDDNTGFVVIDGEVTPLPASKTSFDTIEYVNNPHLSVVYAPNVTSVGLGAFANCNALASVSLPAATWMESDVFYGCPALTTLNLSSLSISYVQGQASIIGINPPSGHTVTITCSDGTCTITGD